MARGDVFFDIGFADNELSVPMVMTLVDLEATDVVEGERTHLFLFVDSVLGSREDRSLIGLTEAQVAELMTAHQLADRLDGLMPRVSPELLESMGF